jgi:hypothetical protein
VVQAIRCPHYVCPGHWKNNQGLCPCHLPHMDGLGVLSEPEATDTDADLLEDNPFTDAALAAAPPGMQANTRDQNQRVGRPASAENPMCNGCGIR